MAKKPPQRKPAAQQQAGGRGQVPGYTRRAPKTGAPVFVKPYARATIAGRNTSGAAQTVKWNGRPMNRRQLKARLGRTGVPVAAWAWRHQDAARRMGIPVPASRPKAALRTLGRTFRRLKRHQFRLAVRRGRRAHGRRRH